MSAPMCMLTGYISDGTKGREIAGLLLEALELQEPYWGAHATGIATINDGGLCLEKDKGHVARVRKTTKIESLEGAIGIAHSRYGIGFWKPELNTKEKAHPFFDCKKRFALMHNGDIANYKEIWAELEGRGHKFSSRSMESDGPAITDSEIAAHMLEEMLDGGKGVGEGLKQICSRFSGTFLLAVIHRDFPKTLWIANWHQPLAVAQGDGEALFTSYEIGLTGVRSELTRVFYPPKNSLITLSPNSVEVRSLLPMRGVPRVKVDIEVLGEEIIKILQRKNERDFSQLDRDLGNEGWGKALGISPDESAAQRKDGIDIVREYIEALNRLVKQGRVFQRIARRPEAGIEDTPRYSYRLA